jgi:fluoride exporter
MIFTVGAGGALGAAARFLLGTVVKKMVKLDFPTGTWIINLTGSTLLGILTGLYVTESISENMWLFSGVGFCGAYTTFSTFGTEIMSFLEQERYVPAIVYIVSSVTLGVLFAAAGYGLAIQ